MALSLFTIYDSRFTLLLIGFDRSAFAASPDLSGPDNQKVNRVVVRFMTKVFRSILSKVEPDKPFAHPSYH
ncbi:MAG: hypothetical protein DMF71_02020 [Acidobacteria bacterium]|nr:MAG: hypothetical protein DMF71_02020 [Acidobacteriota bacterium]